nr:hypothetical protein [uncultured Duganella sp.]
MAVNSVASSNTTVQATPPRQPDPVQAAPKPAEKQAPPAPPPQQAAPAPTVNSNGQRIGTTINTTA